MAKCINKIEHNKGETKTLIIKHKDITLENTSKGRVMGLRNNNLVSIGEFIIRFVLFLN